MLIKMQKPYYTRLIHISLYLSNSSNLSLNVLVVDKLMTDYLKGIEIFVSCTALLYSTVLCTLQRTLNLDNA